jgi:MinD-like ATPase involved in chromosome partitioning or flagellar assembly
MLGTMQNQTFERILNLVYNGKGGVGKTTVAAHLHEWLRYHGLDHLLLDVDDNKSLSRLCPLAEPHALKGKVEVVEDGVKKVKEVVTKEGVESLLHRVLDAEVVLGDNPANVTAEFAQLFAATQFRDAFNSVGARLTFILVLTSSDTVAVDEARRLVAAIKRDSSYVVVLNERLGADFSAYHGSPTHQVLQSLNAPHILFPAIPARVQQVLDAGRLTLPSYIGRYWELRQKDPKAAFSATVSAQEATTALKNAFTAFNSVADALLPTAIAAKAQLIDGDKLKAYCIQRWAEKGSGTL